MKILINNASFGFEVGKKYPATKQDGGFFAKSATLGKFISDSDASLHAEELNKELT